MSDSAWFIGSVTLPEQTFNVNTNGEGNTPVVIPAGTYYLRHPTADLSLIDVVAEEINSQGVVATNPNAEIFVDRDRHIRMTYDSGGNSVAFTWGSATQLRDLFGFNGNLIANGSHNASNISPLLWSPGFPATPATISGVAGYTVDDKVTYVSQDGSQSVTFFYGSTTHQEWSWSHVVPERLRIVADAPTDGGTFHRFYESTMKLGRRFFWYPTIDEGDTQTAVTWDTGLGPYVRRSDTGDWYRRNVPNADVSSPLELNAAIVDEVA